MFPRRLHFLLSLTLLLLLNYASASNSCSSAPKSSDQCVGPGPNLEIGKPQDCCDIQLQTGITRNGVYSIYPFDDNKEAVVKVFCDFQTNGGGWTVLQRREEVRGPIDRFYRNWNSYEVGFGAIEYSHWLGLSKMSALTSGFDQTVRFELQDWEGDSRTAEYEKFSVGDKLSLYSLSLGNYTGTAGDSFTLQSGMPFSTHDRDNDKYEGSCAQEFKGGWWYNACHLSNINGLYIVNGTHTSYADGVNWQTFRGYQYALKRVEMKIRNRNFPNGCFPVPPSVSAKLDSVPVPLRQLRLPDLQMNLSEESSEEVKAGEDRYRMPIPNVRVV